MKTYPTKKISIVTAVILAVVIFTSLGLGFFGIMWGISPSSLESQEGGIIISGIYGETIPHSEIKAIELIYKKPQISRRTNGFAFRSTRKGHFSNAKGKKFKLFIDRPELPWILITKQNGKKIYYSSSVEDNQRIFDAIIKAWPINTTILRPHQNK